MCLCVSMFNAMSIYIYISKIRHLLFNEVKSLVLLSLEVINKRHKTNTHK